jgi:hypothetical protein
MTKVKVPNKPKAEKLFNFPILMKASNSNLVIEFTSEQCGVVQRACNGYDRLYMSSDWASCYNEYVWMPFTGQITLEND